MIFRHFANDIIASLFLLVLSSVFTCHFVVALPPTNLVVSNCSTKRSGVEIPFRSSKRAAETKSPHLFFRIKSFRGLPRCWRSNVARALRRLRTGSKRLLYASTLSNPLLYVAREIAPLVLSSFHANSSRGVMCVCSRLTALPIP